MSDASAERQPGFGFELPPQPAETGETGIEPAKEQLPSAPENAGNRPAAATQMPVAPPVDLPKAEPTEQTNQVVDKLSPPAMPLMPATKNGRIENFWVDSAKSIEAKTVGDPHSRQKALSELGHDFKEALKKDSTNSKAA